MSFPCDVVYGITNFLPTDDIMELMLLSKSFNAMVTPRLRKIDEEMSTICQRINSFMPSPEPDPTNNEWISQLNLIRFLPVGSKAKKRMKEVFENRNEFLRCLEISSKATLNGEQPIHGLKERMSLERFDDSTFLRILAVLVATPKFRKEYNISQQLAGYINYLVTKMDVINLLILFLYEIFTENLETTFHSSFPCIFAFLFGILSSALVDLWLQYTPVCDGNAPMFIDESVLFFLDEIVDTIYKMAKKRIGATIIFSYDSPVEMDFMLKSISKYSRKVEKPFMPAVVVEIFRNDKSPLHDGAMIISVLEQRMHSASNKITTDLVDYDLFPDTKNVGALGLRHWSASSFSNYTDASIVVVSNEKGTVSLFNKKDRKRGKQELDLTKEDLKQRLWSNYISQKQGEQVVTTMDNPMQKLLDGNMGSIAQNNLLQQKVSAKPSSSDKPNEKNGLAVNIRRKQEMNVVDICSFYDKHFSVYFTIQPFGNGFHQDWEKWYTEDFVRTELQYRHNTEMSLPKLNFIVKPGTENYRVAQIYCEVRAQMALESSFCRPVGFFLLYGDKRLGYLEYEVHASKIELEYPHIERSLLHNGVFVEFCKRYFTRTYPYHTKVVLRLNNCPLGDQLENLFNDVKTDDCMRWRAKYYLTHDKWNLNRDRGYLRFEQTMFMNWPDKWLQICRCYHTNFDDVLELIQVFEDHLASLENKHKALSKNEWRKKITKHVAKFVQRAITLL